ncbi:membrane fusion protein, multidrug efflux system [Aliiroseovarius halocynthiae]|uniref:Efflux RND transporter periplasmic adaptor subunit n=1 Tax=Aliiroseovarius halocynthiae TaxID=985055 RepID=A0A545SWY6_9RHOB|nr:efflux RND transporter periplasmic adaptor subunit [Aliiroseovarius halocynthiae]TQV69483.1 efflux RND transporter periplasmic adaptor subunit [Aliiroseovarius halocynthiae]SMR72883.1 membrane fusion protein, multidrug efflux system [Aliiroseovarius halocynthiae]
MRLFPIVTAVLVVAGLFMLVFQRDTLDEAAGVPETPETIETAAAETADTEGLSVVVLKSEAREIEMPIVIRGRTEASRRVELRSETSGLVISDKLSKGLTVAKGDVLCRLDPGTRAAGLAEAKARLAEAKARAPEAGARVIEAQARLDEATINLTAADKLSQGGFASDTRVANARAGVETARAGVISAQSGAASSDAAIQSASAAVAAAEREIERLEIRAPFAGELEIDTADIGTLLQPGAHCATLVQYEPVRIVGFVSELLVDQLSSGLVANVRLASGRMLLGAVSFVADTADPVTRTFRVDVEVRPADGDIPVRAGQTAEIVATGKGTEAHLLPQSALTLNDSGTLGVRIALEGATAGFKPITVVRDSIEGVWVTGLGNAAEVIIIGHHYVTDGVPLAITYQEAGL